MNSTPTYKELENKVTHLQGEVDKLHKEIALYKTELLKSSDYSRKLAESELKFKKFFEDDLTGDFIIDGNGVILDCNGSFLEIFGYEDKDELIGNDISLIYRDRSEFESIKDFLKKERKIKNLEGIRQRKNGDLINVVVNLVAGFNSDGAITEIKGYVYDITERKNLETALIQAKETAEESKLQIQQITNNLNNSMVYQVIALDENHRQFTFLSDTVKKFYGCTPEEGKADANIIYGRFHKDDMQRLMEEERHAIKNMSVFNTEARVVNPNGKIRWSSFVSSPRVYKDVIYWDGIEIDITDKKNNERELIIAKEKAEESDRLKSAFLANMSHEIRTPMNAIIGFASFLKNVEKSREEIEKYVDIIINSGNHLLNLINDIIDISKIDAQQVKIVYSPTSINNLLTELYFFFQSQVIARQKDKVKIFYKTPEKEFYANTDETRLRQILINLIGNAVKFTSEGYIEFGYRLQESKLLFYVKDTGIGIADENQDIIFERFTQAANTTERLYGGTGLGLSITKACVEMLGGKIWLESAIEKGSTFYFTIDYLKCEKSILQQENIPVKNITFQGEHILIAEDDEISIQYLEEVFKPFNLKISHTRKGKETLDFILNNKELQLVIMDIQMPEMNGWEITRYLRSINNKIPIIAQTAYAFDSDRAESMNAGCNAFLTKPTRAEELLNVVYTHLNKD